MAHIGALKVIERAGIPIDIITGTSMGALIGGLYSIGYDAATLDSLVSVQDWSVLLTDRSGARPGNLAERDKQNTYIVSRPLVVKKPGKERSNAAGGLIRGANLARLFARLTAGWHDSIDFADLPIPFACVATNIVDNTEYDFFSGRLATAMRASMAIPGVFTPVRISIIENGELGMEDYDYPCCENADTINKGNHNSSCQIPDSQLRKKDLVLVDGGLRNNYPADLAKRMGADVIIGVSVQSPPRTAADINTGGEVLMQIIDINCKNKYDDNWAMTDIPIKVDVKGFSSASFTTAAVDSLITRGEQAAMRHWDELARLGEELHSELTASELRADSLQHVRRQASGIDADFEVRLDSVAFVGLSASDADYVAAKYGLRKGMSVTTGMIEEGIGAIGSDLLYTDAGYYLDTHDGRNILTVTAGERKAARVNLGVRFDTEEMVALQANVTHRPDTRVPLELELTGRLGKRMTARVGAALRPLSYGRISMSYTLRHDNIDVYENGRRSYGFTYNRHTFTLEPLSFDIRNFACAARLQADFYNFHNVLIGQGAQQERLDNLALYSYVFTLDYDTEDRRYFATRGSRLAASFVYHTDNFVGYDGAAGISAAALTWRATVPVGSRLALEGMLAGRFLFGSDVPLILRNAVGGARSGQYIGQQLPFAGIGRIEFTDDALAVMQLTARQRMGSANYVSGRLSLAQRSGKLRNLFARGPMFGCEASYYYDSIFGPLGATFGYSGHTRKAYFYVNLGYYF